MVAPASMAARLMPRIFGLAAAALAYTMVNDTHDTYEGVTHERHAKHEADIAYNMMVKDRMQYPATRYGLFDHIRHQIHWDTNYSAPVLLYQNLKMKVNTFIDLVIMDNLAPIGLGIAGLVSGFYPELSRLIANRPRVGSPGAFSRALGAIGTAAFTAGGFVLGAAGTVLSHGARLLWRGGVPALAALGVAAFFGMRYQEVEHGIAQQRTFPDIWDMSSGGEEH